MADDAKQNAPDDAAAEAQPPAGPDWLETILKAFPEATATNAVDGYNLSVSLEQYRDVIQYVRDQHGFAFPSCITAVDWQDRLELVVQLYQLQEGLHNPPLLMVRVDGLPREGAHVPSITPLFPGLNWHERETYDMYGIAFDDHPNPRRILLPDNWQGGYPLLKDFVDRRPKRPRLVRFRE